MKKTLLVVAVVVAAGVGGYWLGARPALSPAPLDALASPAQAAYVCPMHAHIVQNHPGSCPICGMDLVALKEAGGDGARQIHVDTATQHKLGVRLAAAEQTPLTHDMPAYGTLVADESAVLRLTAHVDGILTRLHVSRPGQRIARGQLLFEVDSQEALGLQYEYIDILRRALPAMKMAEERRAQNREILARAQGPDAVAQAELGTRQSEEQLDSILQPMRRDRERLGLRLRQFGFDDALLAQLARSGQALNPVPVRARQACVVQQVLARAGMSVNAMTEVLQCVDPAQLWVEIALYPDQLAWVEEGDAVSLRFADGETARIPLKGLHPLLDEATRSLRVRLPLPPGRSRSIGEYVAVTLHSTPRDVLSVPKSAVMRSGRGDFVMRALDKGHFMPVEVTTGIETAERIAIRDGLEAGDQVAVNGQFLLDAAASLADTAQRMRVTPKPAP